MVSVDVKHHVYLLVLTGSHVRSSRPTAIVSPSSNVASVAVTENICQGLLGTGSPGQPSRPSLTQLEFPSSEVSRTVFKCCCTSTAEIVRARIRRPYVLMTGESPSSSRFQARSKDREILEEGGGAEPSS